MSDLPEEALVESQKLLLSAKCGLRQSLHLTGKLTAVSVLILPDAAGEMFRRVQVICHAAGQLAVDWQRFGVWMTEDFRGQNSTVVLDGRGRSLPVKLRYSDFASLTFRDPSLFGLEPLQELEGQLVSVGRFDAPIIKGRAGPPPPPLPEKISTDGLLTARTEILPDDSLKIEVETSDESLRHTGIALEIRSATSGEILYRTEFKLQFKSGMYGEWFLKDELHAIQETVDLFVYPVRGRSKAEDGIK